MKLIVGLGNPGSRYLRTRHNIGFMLIDAMAYRWGPSTFKKEHKAETLKLNTPHGTFLLAKPQTYMNLSGESVAALMNYYKIELDDLLVAHDEVEFEFEVFKFQRNRGHGGNNGIRNIHQMLGTKDYPRLRMGVGRPKNPRLDVADYVLQDFDPVEWERLPDYLNRCCEASETFVELGFEKAATKINSLTNGGPA